MTQFKLVPPRPVFADYMRRVVDRPAMRRAVEKDAELAKAQAKPAGVMAIVLLPGFMLDDGLWDDMVPLLQSVGPIHFGDLSQNDTVASMARHVLSSAPARFVLVGFPWVVTLHGRWPGWRRIA